MLIQLWLKERNLQLLLLIFHHIMTLQYSTTLTLIMCVSYIYFMNMQKSTNSKDITFYEHIISNYIMFYMENYRVFKTIIILCRGFGIHSILSFVGNCLTFSLLFTKPGVVWKISSPLYVLHSIITTPSSVIFSSQYLMVRWPLIYYCYYYIIT